MANLYPGQKLFIDTSNVLKAGLPRGVGSGVHRLSGAEFAGMLVGNMRGVGPQETVNNQTWLDTLNSGTIACAANATTGVEEVTMTTNAAALSNTQRQESFDAGTTGVLRYVPLADTVIAFGASVKLSEVTTQGFWFGLSVLDTSITASGDQTISDGIGFFAKTADSAKLYGSITTSSTPVNSANLQTMVAGDYYELECRINGVSNVEVFVNGVKTAATATAMLSLPTVALAFSIAYAANAKTCIYKNMYCYQWGIN
jgi:hypothetical protein